MILGPRVRKFINTYHEVIHGPAVPCFVEYDFSDETISKVIVDLMIAYRIETDQLRKITHKVAIDELIWIALHVPEAERFYYDPDEEKEDE